MSSKLNVRYGVLSVLCLIQLMVILDATIITIALPDMQSNLFLSDMQRNWIVTVYTLAFGAMLPLGGRLGEFYGYRKILFIGLSGFLIFSALGGLAQNFLTVAFSRSGQGLFAALLAPTVLSLISVAFTQTQIRNKALAAYAFVSGAGGGIGLIIGGLLTQFFNWRWCFYVIIIGSLIALVFSLVLLNVPQTLQKESVDYLGAALISAALFIFILSFSRIDQGGIDTTSVGLLAISLCLFFVFIRVEKTVENPIMPLKIFRNTAINAAFINILLLGFGSLGVFVFLTYYFRQVVEYSPLVAAFAFLPYIFSYMAGNSICSRFLLPRLGKKLTCMWGFIINFCGMFLFATALNTHASYISIILPGLVLIGLGSGISMIALFRLCLDDAEPELIGSISVVINSMQEIGNSVGTALLGIIAVLAGQSYHSRVLISSGHQSMIALQVHSDKIVFLFTAIFLIIGAIISMFLLKSDRKVNDYV